MQSGKERPNGYGPCASTVMKRHPKLSCDDSVKAAHNIYTFGHPCARKSNELPLTGLPQVPLPTMQLHRLNTSTIRCYQNTFTFICSTRPNETNGSSLVFLGPGKQFLHSIAHPKLLGDTFLSAQFKLRLINVSVDSPVMSWPLTVRFKWIQMASGGNMELKQKHISFYSSKTM